MSRIFTADLIAKARGRTAPGTGADGAVASCPRCGWVGPPGAVDRHRKRMGHESDEAHDDIHGEEEDVTKGEGTTFASYFRTATMLAKAASGRKPLPDKRRCTVCGEVLNGEAGVERHFEKTRHASHGPVYEDDGR